MTFLPVLLRRSASSVDTETSALTSLPVAIALQIYFSVGSPVTAYNMLTEL